MTRDKSGQVLLADYLRAYAGTPIITEGNLPGGGRLFESCTRAVEAEQLSIGQATFGEAETTHPLACERERAKVRVALRRAARAKERGTDGNTLD